MTSRTIRSDRRAFRSQRGAVAPGWLAAALVVAAAGGAAGFVVGDRDAPSESVVEGAVDHASGVAPVRTCPNGDVVTELGSGDRVHVTAIDPSGDWLELRDPLDLGRRVWIERSAVDPDRSLDDLDVIACGERVAYAAGSTVPTTSSAIATTSTVAVTTTSPGPTTVPVTAPPTTAPPTTAAPDTTAPRITAVVKDTEHVYENQPAVCPGHPYTVEVSATVTDAVGVAQVVVRWSVNGNSGEVPATRAGSNYSATLGPFDEDTIPQTPGQDDIAFTFRATDAAGNVASTSNDLQIFDCTFL